MLPCPLCKSYKLTDFEKDKKRTYLHCSECGLVFVPDEYHVEEPAEKCRYDKHCNNINDKFYVAHLEELINPLCDFLKPGYEGLDFGSGPEPVLAQLMQKAGFEVSIYDVFYANNPEVLSRTYDFITSCEVVEHFRYPAKEWETLFACLKPDGILAIKTEPYDVVEVFKNWYYKNDITHVCFYSVNTMKWIAQRWNVTVKQPAKNVFLFFKKETAG